MRSLRLMRQLCAVSAASFLALASPAAMSHGGSASGQGYTMGGAGSGAMMGPGMMGPGMMGPGMMGPGMMGSTTMGPGYGMHGDPMRLGANLTTEQRTRIAAIRSELRRQQWDTLGAALEARDELYALLATEQPDPSQVGAAFDRLSKLRRQMLEAHVAAHNRMLGVLSDEQRAQMDEWQHGAMHGGAYGGHPYGLGHGMMMPGM